MRNPLLLALVTNYPAETHFSEVRYVVVRTVLLSAAAEWVAWIVLLEAVVVGFQAVVPLLVVAEKMVWQFCNLKQSGALKTGREFESWWTVG
jgi:hypothetical protein